MIKKIYALPLCILFACSVLAQSPGGVSANLTMWIKSNSGVSVSGGLLDSWTYANDGTFAFTSTGSDRPTFTGSLLNFYPGVAFNNNLMIGPDGSNLGAPIAAGDDSYCLFAIWRSTTNGTFQRVWSQRNLGGSDNADGFSLATWNDNRFGNQLEKNPYDQGMLSSYTQNVWTITHLNLIDQLTDDVQLRDQTNISGTPLTATTNGGAFTGAALRSLVDGTNRLGARDNAGEEALQGNLAELIVYDDTMNLDGRNKIYSYLSVKYGITKAGDYVAADGTIFWDSTVNSAFRFSIFGIGQDDASGLFSTQSNSIETGSGDGTGQSGLANIVLSNPADINDVRFLMIGSNNGSLTESGSEMPTGADVSARRLPREWKVQHTGDLGTVDMSVDLTGITVTGNFGSVNDFRLMIDTDGDGDFSTGNTRYYTPSSITGNVLNFTGISLGNGEIFSVMTFTLPTTLPVTWKDVSAKVVNQNVVVKWAVENNASGKNYEIEHSVDGATFTTAGIVNNDVNVKSYSFTHANLANGKHFYRIHQVDLDGKATYSKVVDVNIKAPDFVISLLNNPVRNGYAEINVNASKAASASIELWSITGTRITILQQSVNAGINRVKVPMGAVSAGNYILKIKVKDVTQSIQVSKQ